MSWIKESKERAEANHIAEEQKKIKLEERKKALLDQLEVEVRSGSIVPLLEDLAEYGFNVGEPTLTSRKTTIGAYQWRLLKANLEKTFQGESFLFLLDDVDFDNEKDNYQFLMPCWEWLIEGLGKISVCYYASYFNHPHFFRFVYSFSPRVSGFQEPKKLPPVTHLYLTTYSQHPKNAKETYEQMKQVLSNAIIAFERNKLT